MLQQGCDFKKLKSVLLYWCLAFDTNVCSVSAFDLGLCWFVTEQIMDFLEMFGVEMSLSRNSHDTLQEE